jgi:hypothetical protein
VTYIRGHTHAKLLTLTEPGPDGRPTTVERLQIVTPDHVYDLDLVAKQGTMIDNARKHAEAAYLELPDADKQAVHRRLRERGIPSVDLAALGRRVGADTVAGRLCDVYELGAPLGRQETLEALKTGTDHLHMKTWVWRDTQIPLKITVTQVGLRQEVRATRIDTRTAVPEERVRVPAGVTVAHDVERSEFARREALATLERLRTGAPQVTRMKVRPQPGEPR